MKRGRRFIENVLPMLLPGLVLAAWQIVCAAGLVPDYLLPSPRQVLQSAGSYLFGAPGGGPYAGRFGSDFAASLGRVVLGFGLAAASGVPLGLLSGRVALVNRLIAATIDGLRAVPGICWLPLALIWFGIGITTTVFLVALAAFFPIYLNTLTGARQAPAIYFQAGAMLGVSRLKGVFVLLVPLAMPTIIAGLRLGLGISWAYLVLGELTGVPNGLGAVIMDARMLGRTDIVLVGILLLAVIGRICDRLLLSVLRLMFKSARRMA